jgi:L-asparaginase / beta-aspartyl-peptidase
MRWIFAALLLAGCATAPQAQNPRWSIAIHGGAGVIERAQLDTQTEAADRRRRA